MTRHDALEPHSESIFSGQSAEEACFPVLISFSKYILPLFAIYDLEFLLFTVTVFWESFVEHL